jgi:glycosyltransferase involved in cell wall biosynthesis
MRIAYVCADAGVPVFGCKGSSVHVQEMLGAFRGASARVELFAMRFDGDAPPELSDMPVHRLPQPPKGVDERERACLAANEDLRRALEAAGPFDLVYERYSLWSHAAMEFANEAGVPFLLEVNAPLVTEQSDHRALIRRAEAEHIAQRLFQQATGVVTVSEEVAVYVRGQGAPVERVHVIPNGVNARRFARDPLAGDLDGRPFTIGFVGTLKPWHGLATLMEAFDQLHRIEPDARLLIVGDGPERATLESDVLARGLLWSVKFAGAVAPTLVPELISQFDVAVAPYTQTEGFYFSPLKVYGRGEPSGTTGRAHRAQPDRAAVRTRGYGGAGADAGAAEV